MATIKAYVNYDERRGVHQYTNFEIVERLPEIGETFNQGDYECVAIEPVELDCEQGSDEAYNYSFYCCTMRHCDTPAEEWDKDEWQVYYAVPILNTL